MYGQTVQTRSHKTHKRIFNQELLTFPTEMGSDDNKTKSSHHGSSSRKQHKLNKQQSNVKFRGACMEMQGHVFNYRPGAYFGTDEFEKQA